MCVTAGSRCRSWSYETLEVDAAIAGGLLQYHRQDAQVGADGGGGGREGGLQHGAGGPGVHGSWHGTREQGTQRARKATGPLGEGNVSQLETEAAECLGQGGQYCLLTVSNRRKFGVSFLSNLFLLRT